MASASNEPLTKEEQEEEEMRNKLKKTGFYYDEMAKDEMRIALNLIKETNSDDLQNIEPSSSLPSFNVPSSDSKLIENTLQISEQKSLPNFSNKNAATANNSQVPSTSSKEYSNGKEKSPDNASNEFYRKNSNNENSNPNNENVFEKNSNTINDDRQVSRNNSNLKNNRSDGPKRRPREKKTPETLKESSLERWRFNPLLLEEDKDIPTTLLEEHFQNQQSISKEYSPYSDEELDSETFEKLCQEMCEKLDTLHEQYSILDASTRESYWGSPIKVSTNWNDSSDKNLPTKKTSPENNNISDIPVRHTLERATKRKAAHTIAAAINDADNSDENSDNEFINTKKRKQGGIKKLINKIQESQQNNDSSKSSNNIETNEVDNIKCSSDSEVFENSDFCNSHEKAKTEVSINLEPVEEQLQYPRKIVPPNPLKKSFKGPRSKRKNTTQLQNNSIKKNLNDEEINKTLYELDKEIDDNDPVEIYEIRTSSASKNVSDKIQMARYHLENKRELEEQKIKTEEEAKKEKERNEMQKRDELICKRLQEEMNENIRKLEKEKKAKEQTEFYKNRLNMQTQRITRLNFNKSKPNYEEIDEDVLLNDDDDDELTIINHTNVITRSSCPICQKSFPSDEIISHASECDAFSSESDEINYHQPSTSHSNINCYECEICNRYKTSDGNRYDEHVIKCKEKAEDRRNEIYV